MPSLDCIKTNFIIQHNLKQSIQDQISSILSQQRSNHFCYKSSSYRSHQHTDSYQFHVSSTWATESILKITWFPLWNWAICLSVSHCVGVSLYHTSKWPHTLSPGCKELPWEIIFWTFASLIEVDHMIHFELCFLKPH